MEENSPSLKEGLVFLKNSKRIKRLIKKIDDKISGIHNPDASSFIQEMKDISIAFEKVEFEWKHGDKQAARKRYKILRKQNSSLVSKINNESFKKFLKTAGIVGVATLAGLLVKEVVDYGNQVDDYGATRIDRAVKTDPKLFDEFVSRTAKAEGVSEKLLRAMIQQESQGFEHAIGTNSNGTRDMGLMQLNSNTIPWLKEKFWDGDHKFDALNPHDNIELGTKYLKFLTDRYKGNIDKIVTAYNAGISVADKGTPPSSTLAYIANVKKFIKRG